MNKIFNPPEIQGEPINHLNLHKNKLIPSKFFRFGSARVIAFSMLLTSENTIKTLQKEYHLNFFVTLQFV